MESQEAHISRVVDRGRSRVLILGLLSIVLAVVSVRTFVEYLLPFPFGVDLHIPLEAARRWLAGEPPYLAGGFSSRGGYDLPFLYPPYVLPAFALMTLIPTAILYPVVFGACLSAYIYACRRLAIPWPAIPLMLLWAPFYEGLVTMNVQALLFAAFVTLFWTRPVVAPLVPRRRDLAGRNVVSNVRNGLLATIVGAIKVAQVHPWLYYLRIQPAAAIAAGAIAALVPLLTLPLLGTQIWSEWLEQTRRAIDPDWIASGASLGTTFGPIVGVAAAGISLAAVAFVPRRLAGAWIGLLVVVAAPNLHTHGLVFLLPALLIVRREIALVMAALIAAYNPIAWWIAIAGLAWCLAAATTWPRLLAQARPRDVESSRASLEHLEIPVREDADPRR